jgi:hypothetical protein
MDKIEMKEVEFNEKLYQKNIQENDFSDKEMDGIGEDNGTN